MNIGKNVEKLKLLIGALVSARVKDAEGWHRWRRDPENERFMEQCFSYERGEGMPSVTSLVKPFFHPDPDLPLIGLNYTQVAHNTLHAFANGWTEPMRLCRGIVFDRRRVLVAFPFPKFFNFGEQAETRNLPDESFVATVKQDGHLGIIFQYRGQILCTTRGCFVSGSAEIGNQMLEQYREQWLRCLPKDITLLAEIIDPATEVHVKYGGWRGFVLIGAFNRRTFQDFDYEELEELGSRLGLKVTERWSGSSVEELRALMHDLSVENQEGFVARFASGLRVKFKFKSYIALMIGEKLTPRYVMMRLTQGNFHSKIADLPGEIQLEAQAIERQLLAVADVVGDKKARWEYLYSLVPDEERTDYHKSICRSFHAWLVREGRIPPPPQPEPVKKTSTSKRRSKAAP